MNECSENGCENQASWVRHTQFAGNHYFCTDHALAEDNFGQDDVSYFHCPILIVERFCGSNKMKIGFEPDRINFIGLFSNVVSFLKESENKCHKRFKDVKQLLNKYSVQREPVGDNSIKYGVDIEKLMDDYNLGELDKDLYRDSEILMKEGALITDNTILDERLFKPIKMMTLSFSYGEDLISEKS